MTTQTFGLAFEADADVVKPDHDHVEECVAAHPNEPCPGYPHTTDAPEG